MPGASVITYKGKRIVFNDFSNSANEEILATMKEAVELIRTQPPESVYVITDTSGSSMYNKEIAAAFKEFVAGNKPFVKMSVVVGIDGIKKVLYDAVILFSRRKNLVLMNSIDEAKEFLSKQP
ncbi:MAG: hypothetical protein JXR81_09475 [Candidatus Goldbacteria bacterium]|nr:hypothetical protein [Candidatus Goldiibacteriota bacterium]